MPSDDAQAWYQDVYSAIQQIPYGQCTTYGHIALLIGYPRRARQVGMCLKHLPAYDPADTNRHFFHDGNVPWQRVVNARGGISARGDDGLGAQRQVQRLRGEGVEVHDGRGAEESWIDLSRWGWFPKSLPGEEEDEDESSSVQGGHARHTRVMTGNVV